MNTTLEYITRDGPIAVDGRQYSPLFRFEVAAEAEKVFLRFIALWRDNEPLGGAAPTFEIKAGDGILTSVDPYSGRVEIRNNVGSDAENAGVVTCQRMSRDIYLLTISELLENSNPWKIRIKNNDQESLRFLGFVSPDEDETNQPWMVIENSLSSDDRVARLTVIHNLEHQVRIRNWGTKTLNLYDGAGTQIGGADSPVTIKETLNEIKPHEVRSIKIDVGEISASRVLPPYEFRCNDPLVEHTKLELTLTRTFDPPPPPPPPEFFCRLGCGCNEYLSSDGSGSPCRRCRHSFAVHTDVLPSH